ncbi:MAG: hypothetical protein MUC69_09790 [Gemmatimonadales bacterium]|jgi:hypothetical protein|nr:hypothetical protein [Gemmatimonadales bacterium]
MSNPRVPERPQESRRALANAYESAMQADRERRAAERRGTGKAFPWVLVVGLLILAGVAGWAFATRPTWLFGATIQEDAPAQDAGLRLTMYAAATRLREHVARTGLAPERLDELPGVSGEGLAYERKKDGSWTLAGRRGTAALTLRSADDIDAFLGTSLSNLLHRGAR